MSGQKAVQGVHEEINQWCEALQLDFKENPGDLYEYSLDRDPTTQKMRREDEKASDEKKHMIRVAAEEKHLDVNDDEKKQEEQNERATPRVVKEGKIDHDHNRVIPRKLTSTNIAQQHPHSKALQQQQQCKHAEVDMKNVDEDEVCEGERGTDENDEIAEVIEEIECDLEEASNYQPSIRGTLESVSIEQGTNTHTPQPTFARGSSKSLPSSSIDDELDDTMMRVNRKSVKHCTSSEILVGEGLDEFVTVERAVAALKPSFPTTTTTTTTTTRDRSLNNETNSDDTRTSLSFPLYPETFETANKPQTANSTSTTSPLQTCDGKKKEIQEQQINTISLLAQGHQQELRRKEGRVRDMGIGRKEIGLDMREAREERRIAPLQHDKERTLMQPYEMIHVDQTRRDGSKQSKSPSRKDAKDYKTISAVSVSKSTKEKDEVNTQDDRDKKRVSMNPYSAKQGRMKAMEQETNYQKRLSTTMMGSEVESQISVKKETSSSSTTSLKTGPSSVIDVLSLEETR